MHVGDTRHQAPPVFQFCATFWLRPLLLLYGVRQGHCWVLIVVAVRSGGNYCLGKLLSRLFYSLEPVCTNLEVLTYNEHRDNRPPAPSPALPLRT